MRRLYTFDVGNKMYHLEISKSNKNVLTAGSPGRIKKIITFLDNPEIIESERGLVTVHGSYKNQDITTFSTGMGPASVSITLPEIIEACDEDDMLILRLGTAGGMQKHFNIGDFVITTDVERAESTSDKIMGKDYIAKANSQIVSLLEKISNIYKKNFQSVYVGRTRVTDDIYFDVKNNKKDNYGDVLAVSMESSVIFALRDRYNKDDNRNIFAGELLTISDNVFGHSEIVDASLFLKQQKDIEKAHIKIGLESIVNFREKFN
jgi:uridine phosphorylase